MAKNKANIIMDTVKAAKAFSREEQIRSGLMPKPKVWGGKASARNDRKEAKKNLRKEY